MQFEIDKETKKCPSCAEFIKLEAIKCRYCANEFDPKIVEVQIEERNNDFIKKHEDIKSKYKQAIYVSQEGKSGEAFCLSCRLVGKRSKMVKKRDYDDYYHPECLKIIEPDYIVEEPKPELIMEKAYSDYIVEEPKPELIDEKEYQKKECFKYTYISQEGESGEAFCFGCRKVGQRSKMLYKKDLDQYYHHECLPEAEPESVMIVSQVEDSVCRANIATHSANNDSNGCLSSIGALVTLGIIIFLIIMTLFGFKYLLVLGLPVGIGTVIIGLVMLFKQFDK